MKIRTHLNMDDLTGVEVLVLDSESVEIHCGGTEITMDEDALTVFLKTGAEVLPRLRASTTVTTASPAPVVLRLDDSNPAGEWMGPRHPVACTWVICNASEPLSCMTLGDSVELDWGVLTWTITGADVLARLLDQTRQAHAILRKRLDRAPRSVPDDVGADSKKQRA